MEQDQNKSIKAWMIRFVIIGVMLASWQIREYVDAGMVSISLIPALVLPMTLPAWWLSAALAIAWIMGWLINW